MICFCYFCQKKNFSSWAWRIMTPFLFKLGPKKQFLRGFTSFFFFRTAGFQHNLLILIVSSNIFIGNQSKKVKWVWSLGQTLGQIMSSVVKKTATGISMVFFIFCHSCYGWKWHFLAKKHYTI